MLSRVSREIDHTSLVLSFSHCYHLVWYGFGISSFGIVDLNDIGFSPSPNSKSFVESAHTIIYRSEAGEWPTCFNISRTILLHRHPSSRSRRASHVQNCPKIVCNVRPKKSKQRSPPKNEPAQTQHTKPRKATRALNQHQHGEVIRYRYH